MKPIRSKPPSYKIAEGPSIANHPKLQDGIEAAMWVSQGWPHRRMYPKNDPKNIPVVTGDRTRALWMLSFQHDHWATRDGTKFMR